MGVRGEAAANLTPESVEVVLIQSVLEEGAGVNARRGVALEVDVVAGATVLMAFEEVV